MITVFQLTLIHQKISKYQTIVHHQSKQTLDPVKASVRSNFLHAITSSTSQRCHDGWKMENLLLFDLQKTTNPRICTKHIASEDRYH